MLVTLAQTADAARGFGIADWLVLAGYGLVLLVTGWWFSRRAAGDTSDYFLAGRQMPAWAVAISVLATSLSAATFLGVPQLGYDSDLTYIATNLGMIAAAIIVAFVILPPIYAAGVATPYGLLERRFGPAARSAAAFSFLLGRVFASGARVYMVAIPAAMILFGDPATGADPGAMIPVGQLALAIGVMTLVGIVYTLAGGVRSVIWTDVIQMVVFTTAIGVAIAVILGRVPGGADAAFETLRGATVGDDPAAPKLRVFDTSLDPTRSFTLLASLTGFVLLGVASYGTDQDLVQRMLTCRTRGRAAASVIASNLMAIPVVAMFFAVGLLLYVFYHGPGSEQRIPPSDTARVFLVFILEELPAGLPGLMLAGLFAAGLSSLNSALNAMSSTVVNDFYRHWRPGRPERHYLLVGRMGVVAWGLILGGFACVCIVWQRSGGESLIGFALGVMTFAYAGLLGVFATLLLTKRGSGRSAVSALAAGFVLVLVQQPFAWGWLVDLEAEAGIGQMIGAFVSLAFPYKLVIASTLAFIVCVLGRPKPA